MDVADVESEQKNVEHMIGNLFRRKKAPWPNVAPDAPFTAIGDVHGRIDLLERALEKATGQIVFVGDYIDRGDASADVLRLLFSRDDLVCLAGNHEEMLLKFLDNPKRHGSRWLRYGGLQTLASFGISDVSESSDEARLVFTRDKLTDAMGSDLIAWLKELPLSWTSGNVTVVHAAADPSVAIDAQKGSVLRWGHPDFRSVERTDGQWIVHGHTVVDQPSQNRGVISIDTAAYATGRLTLAEFQPNKVGFSTA